MVVDSIQNQTEAIGVSMDYGNLTCYDNKQLESFVEFLFLFSSSMQYIVISVAITGVIMNVTGVYILSSRKSMKNTFNLLMVTLFSIDSLFLLAYVYISLTLGLIKVNHPIHVIVSKCIKLFYSFAFNCSIFLTVGISHERFIAMHHPAIHSADMSTGRNQALRLLKYLFPITVTAVFLCVPEYLESEFVINSIASSNLQNTSLNSR